MMASCICEMPDHSQINRETFWKEDEIQPTKPEPEFPS